MSAAGAVAALDTLAGGLAGETGWYSPGKKCSAGASFCLQHTSVVALGCSVGGIAELRRRVRLAGAGSAPPSVSSRSSACPTVCLAAGVEPAAFFGRPLFFFFATGS